MPTDRELMQQALDALLTWKTMHPNTTANVVRTPAIEALRARLAQGELEPVATVYDAYDTTGIDWHCKDAPATGTKLYAAPPQPNDFNPDWDAMAVMVEEQQRMAKRIEELEARLAQGEPEPTRSQKLRDAGYERRKKGWDKDGDEQGPKPQAHMLITEQGVCGGIFRFRYDAEVAAREGNGRFSIVPLYTAPPQHTWQGLTDEEIDYIYLNTVDFSYNYERAIEAKLKEKNHG